MLLLLSPQRLIQRKVMLQPMKEEKDNANCWLSEKKQDKRNLKKKRTSDAQLCVSQATLTQVKHSFQINFVKLMSRQVRLAVSHSKLVPHTSLWKIFSLILTVSHIESHSSQKFQVSQLSIRPDTNHSLTCVLEEAVSAIWQYQSQTLCTVQSSKLLNQLIF